VHPNEREQRRQSSGEVDELSAQPSEVRSVVARPQEHAAHSAHAQQQTPPRHGANVILYTTADAKGQKQKVGSLLQQKALYALRWFVARILLYLRADKHCPMVHL
jgi:hypothetical protein